MTELKCGFCKRGSEVEEECGELHHVVTASGKPCTAHHKCMQYSALLVQYKSEHFGGFKISKVFDELFRGRTAKCFICKSKKGRHKSGTGVCVTGATCGCAVKQCRKTFHYYCAKTSKDCVTKRLVVNFKSKNKITVLYRVFCSKEHEIQYRRNLKEYSKDMNRSEEESEAGSDSEISNKEEEDDKEDLLLGGFDVSSQLLSQHMNENGHDTSFITASTNISNGNNDKVPNNHLKRSASSDSLCAEEKPPKYVKLDTKKVYGLCILSSDINVAQRKDLYTMINTNYDVKEIVIWQDVTSYTLKSELTPYFIHAISKAIRSNSYKNLQNLLFSEKYLQNKCISDYEYQSNFIQDLKDPAVAKKVLQSTWKSVSKNLQDTSTNIGKEIGNVINVCSSNVLLLLVGDEIDKNNDIRQKLQHLVESRPKSTVFEWKNDMQIKKFDTKDSDENEVNILVSNIMKNKSEIGKVIDEPNDKILLESNTQSNVVCCILQGLEGTDLNSVQDKSLCLVLVSNLDCNVVNCENYIIKLIKNILTDNHDKYSKFSMVLPVAKLPSTFNIVDNIKNCVDFDVTIAIYSAYNPEKQCISYIIADIMINDQSATNGQIISSPLVTKCGLVTECRPCVEDDEKPSTSGSNKRRRLKPTLSPSALSLQHMLRQSS